MNTPLQQPTIIYGGAFNPPTLAHQLILQACVDEARRLGADVWLLLSGDRLDKTIQVSRDVRMQYARALIEDVDSKGVKIEVITAELDRAKLVETCDTVDEFAATYPGRHMIWVFGADSIGSMPTWRDGERLRESLDKLVILRPGTVIEANVPKMRILTVVTPDVSSTEVRRRMATGEPLVGLVSRRVEAAIVASGTIEE